MRKGEAFWVIISQEPLGPGLEDSNSHKGMECPQLLQVLGTEQAATRSLCFFPGF